MRVLVTRANPAAERTAARLAARGHQPILLPLSRAIHDRVAADAALEKAQGPLLLTSAEAVRVIGHAPEAARSRPVFAVGEATAQAAREAGFTTIATAEGTGISLAALVVERLAGQSPTPLAYLAGFPRSQDLETLLHAAGIPVDVCECYRIEALEPEDHALEALLAKPPEAVLLYSRESALRLFNLPVVRSGLAAFTTTAFLCISDKTASAIPAALASGIRIAATPDETALLALLPVPSSQF